MTIDFSWSTWLPDFQGHFGEKYHLLWVSNWWVSSTCVFCLWCFNRFFFGATLIVLRLSQPSYLFAQKSKGFLERIFYSFLIGWNYIVFFPASEPMIDWGPIEISPTNIQGSSLGANPKFLDQHILVICYEFVVIVIIYLWYHDLPWLEPRCDRTYYPPGVLKWPLLFCWKRPLFWGGIDLQE